MARERAARVWLRGLPVGAIFGRRREEVRFRYDEAVADTHGLNIPVLSCSLPTSQRPAPARPFFAGLLPEGDARRKLAADAGLVVSDVIGLLARYGQDVAGAVVVGEAVSPRPRAHVEVYSDDTLVAEVAALDDRSAPLALHADSELSIAGLQDKMLLVRTPEGWARPVNGYPSTHILKLDDRAHRGLVFAEHTCLQLARSAGIPAAAAEISRVGELDVLIVERFDRTPGPDGVPARLHQEDACQALGLDLETNPGAKYEAGGGPRLRQIAEVLRSWGTQENLYRLLDQVVFTVATGNADAHGKNVTLLHSTIGQVQLAPLYDTVPTALWPNLRTQAAMSIGSAVDLAAVTVADIVHEAKSWQLPVRAAGPRVRDTLERVRDAVDHVEVAEHAKATQALALVRRRTNELLDGSTREGLS